jgi:hypothetical protein
MKMRTKHILLALTAGATGLLIGSYVMKEKEFEEEPLPGTLEVLGIWNVVRNSGDGELIRSAQATLQDQADAARAVGDDLHASALGTAADEAGQLLSGLGSAIGETLGTLFGR